MTRRGRGGRPWGPLRGESREAEALAVFLRERVDASGLTMTAVAGLISCSKTQVGLYLAGRIPERKFVTALVKATVPEPRQRALRLAEAENLLHAARNPRPEQPAPAESRTTALAAELELARRAQVETYDRLTRALEQRADLQQAAQNSTHLVMVLLGMINTLAERVRTLSAQHGALQEHTGDPQALEDTRRQLARALDQEQRAKDELARARDKQRQAEDLAARVQQRVDELTDELDRLRTAQPDPETGPDTGTGPANGTPHNADDHTIGGRTPDPVADDIDHALDRASAVNDADDHTLQRITDELHHPGEDPPAEPGQHTTPKPPAVVPDNPNNPPTSTDAPHPAASTALLPATGTRPVEKTDDFTTRHRHAAGLAEAGQHAEAAQLFADLVADQARTLGTNHPDTLTTRNEHAYNLGETAQHAEAARLFADLVADQARTQGPDHPDTLNARHNHAYNLGQIGWRAEAARLFADLVTDRTRIQGPDHPHTLNARHQHAHDVGQNGQHAEAARLFADLIRDRTRIQGPDHPHTLDTRHQHAYSLGESGQRTEASRLLDGLVKDRIRVLGPEHPDTLTTRHRQLFNLGEAGRNAEAAHMFADLIRDRIRVLGPDHPRTLDTRHEHAYNVGAAGQRGEAAQLLADLLADRIRVLGPDHPHTLATRRLHEVYTGR